MHFGRKQKEILIPALVICLAGIFFRMTGMIAAQILTVALGLLFAVPAALRLHNSRSVHPGDRNTAILLFPAAGLMLLSAVSAADALLKRTAAFSFLELLSFLALLGAAVCLALQAGNALKKRAHPLPHIGLTVCLALKLIHDFRVWSVQPQVGSYCFSLFSLLCLLLAAMYHAGLQLREGKRRSAALFCLLGILFSGMASVGTGFSGLCFSLGGLLYLIALLQLLLRRRKRASAPEAAPSV